MRFNPASLLLLPGLCIVGALVAGWRGVSVALGCWSCFVAVATVLHVISAYVHQSSAVLQGKVGGDAEGVTAPREAP